ncbi:MAG: hypothetical protein HXY53_10470 [Nitrospirae bacterium]|nr:hypothetical protein [Nitrospirota bacterium]
MIDLWNQKGDCIEAFIKNINWAIVEAGLK